MEKKYWFHDVEDGEIKIVKNCLKTIHRRVETWTRCSRIRNGEFWKGGGKKKKKGMVEDKNFP